MRKNWKYYTLWLAGIYNIIWGTWVGLMPNHFYELFQLPLPVYPVVWQSVGMMVGFYGIGYIIAAYDPVRYWPLIAIGFSGKIMGPLGFLFYNSQGEIQSEFIYMHIPNDFIWLIPFGYILWKIKNDVLASF